MKLSPDFQEAPACDGCAVRKTALTTAPGPFSSIYFFWLMSTEARVCSQSRCIAQADPV
jgi:hypothetical protein